MSDSLHIVCPHDDTVNRVPRARLGDGPRCAKCHQPLFAAEPAELTTERFDTHLTRSDIPVVVDFWAPWCGPCVAMAPAYREAARELEPQLRVAKVDTQSEPDLAERFGIRSIPTLVLFSGGREIARQSGALPRPAIVAWIRSQLHSSQRAGAR